MENTSTLRYIAYLLFFGTLLLIGFTIESRLNLQAEEEFLLTPLFYYSILFPTLFGILLAIPIRKLSLKKRKSWSYNWTKCLVFSIPSLFVLLFPAYYFTLLSWGDIMGFANILFGNDRLHFLAGIVLGFSIIYSIEDKEVSE